MGLFFEGWETRPGDEIDSQSIKCPLDRWRFLPVRPFGVWIGMFAEYYDEGWIEILSSERGGTISF